MRKLLFTALLGTGLSSSLYALDIQYGQGNFEATAGIQNFYSATVDCDIDVFSISEHHALISDKLYLFGRLDIYSSDKVESVASYVDEIMSTTLPSLPVSLPFDLTSGNAILGNFVPIPSSYEVEGVDFDIGIGMDLVQESDYFVGVGVVTGVSTPLVKMENYFEALNYFTNLLEATRTEMTTYKFGVSLQAGYEPNEWVKLYGTGIYAYQTGEMSNSIVDSDMDSEGTYSSLEVGVRITPPSLENFYVSVGYVYKDWEVDSMQANILGFETPDAMDIFDMELSSSNLYVSVGYRF